MGRKKERIAELEGCLDRIIDWAHARGGDYEAMTSTVLQVCGETLEERNDLRRDKERLSAELARATTSSEYEAAWETVRLEFGVKDKPIGPERAAMEVRSIVRERMEETVSLRAKVAELQSDNEVLRDLRDTMHDVVIASNTALRHEFGLAAGPLPDVIEGACEAHRKVLESLATERTTTARLTEELAHARGQLEAALSENASSSADASRAEELTVENELIRQSFADAMAILRETFGPAPSVNSIQSAVAQACETHMAVVSGLNGLASELAGPIGMPLADVPVLARAHIVSLNGEATRLRAKVEDYEGRIRSYERTTADALKVQTHRNGSFRSWTPNLGDKVRLDTIVYYRGLSAMFDGVVTVSVGPYDHQTMAVRMADLRPADEKADSKGVEADAHGVAIGDQVSLDSLDEGCVVAFVKVDGVTYAQVQWRKGERLIHDIPLVKEWRDLYLKSTLVEATEPAATGQQHGDAPSIGAFDALGRENTRLRRKLERVFEALKDTPTEAT